MHHDDSFTTIIKYFSCVVILIAMLFHTLGITPWNSILQLIAIAGWTYVVFKWQEKSIILNFLPQVLIIIPGLIYLWIWAQ